MSFVFRLIRSLRVTFLRSTQSAQLILVHGKSCKFRTMCPSPGGYATYIRQICNNVREFPRGPIPHHRKSYDVLEGRKIYGWSREDCRALRGCAKTTLGVALILTSRMYILCPNTSIRDTCQMLPTKIDGFMIIKERTWISSAYNRKYK